MSLASLIAEQERVFLDQQPESARMHRRAVESLAGRPLRNYADFAS